MTTQELSHTIQKYIVSCFRIQKPVILNSFNARANKLLFNFLSYGDTIDIYIDQTRTSQRVIILQVLSLVTMWGYKKPLDLRRQWLNQLSLS